MTDRELADLAESHLEQTTISYPEYVRRLGQGHYKDVTKTHWWQALNALGKIGAGEPVPTPEPEPPAATWPENPRAPWNSIRNAPGLGINVIHPVDITDAVINGTGDTGVLFQKDAAGSTMARVRMTNIAAGNSVPYGKHGVYGKAANLTLSDIYVSCSGYCASGISMRYDGAVVRRSEIEGAPHALTYYETSQQKGEVLYEDIRGRFTGDTAVWMDAEVDYTQYVIQRFIFRRVAMLGAGVFLKVAAVRFRGAVTIDDCTLNGRQVTKADCPGVPNVEVI